MEGGYAEYISVLEEFVTPIPDNFDSAHALLLNPGITAYKAVKASEPAAGKTVGIFGIGRRWSPRDSDSQDFWRKGPSRIEN